MKLVVFTPAIRSSAIGRMTCLVIRALVSQGHELTVVRTETERLLETQTHEFNTELIKWNNFNQVMSFAIEADALVYQIGNNYEFHEGGVEWLQKLPGLVCLHDFFLGHLFWEWAQTRRQQADTVLLNWYGDKIASRFFGHSSSEEFIDGTLLESPMTEWICSMALGVLTHSSWGIGRVLSSCPGPVHVVPLAYDAPAMPTHTSVVSFGDNNQLRLLTIGHINANKRVDRVIRAIGNSPVLRQRIVYRLCGAIQSATTLELYSLARKCQVNLIISGEVDEAVLGEAMQQADVVCCLRWPSLEAASASAIESMLYGKPIIVTDSGFCAEIPTDCALRISPDREIHDIEAALEQFVADPSLRENIGSRAKQWASEQFSAEHYALRLATCVTVMCKAAPAIRAVEYFSNLIQRWSGSIEILPESDIDSLKVFEPTSR